jgi:hypothetical protein
VCGGGGGQDRSMGIRGMSIIEHEHQEQPRGGLSGKRGGRGAWGRTAAQVQEQDGCRSC